mmetsp:Transcript_43643/g.98469  ORF Transcript_43643/g.98469 Transcript_43643/m.98469 type:complete len:729 (+) Transcript_43643:140-2326(+)
MMEVAHLPSREGSGGGTLHMRNLEFNSEAQMRRISTRGRRVTHHWHRDPMSEIENRRFVSSWAQSLASGSTGVSARDSTLSSVRSSTQAVGQVASELLDAPAEASLPRQPLFLEASGASSPDRRKVMKDAAPADASKAAEPTLTQKAVAMLEVLENQMRLHFEDMLGNLRASHAEYLTTLQPTNGRLQHRWRGVHWDESATEEFMMCPWVTDGGQTRSSLFGPSTSSLLSGTNPLQPGHKSMRFAVDEQENLKKQKALASPDRSRTRSDMTTNFISFKDSFRGWASRLSASTTFQLTFVALILLNALVIGIEVDYPYESAPPVFTHLDRAFAAMFLFELIVRMIGEGRKFLARESLAWNVFDSGVVASSILEVVWSAWLTTGMTEMSQISNMRIIRVVRILRTFRMARIVRFASSVRSLLHSITATLRSLGWAMLLILLIFYGFGIIFTQAVHDYMWQKGVARAGGGNLTEFWGTLPRSMFTLFMSISGGISWWEVVVPLREAGILWVAIFSLYITFCVFTVLNVITGVFCQSAMESAQNDKDLATMRLMANHEEFKRSMDRFFKEIDRDGSGQITLHELDLCCQDERSLAYLWSLGINSNDVWTLFKLLDDDGSGTVDREEFIEGCMKLKGEAKAVHMAKLGYDVQKLTTSLADFMGYVEETLEDLVAEKEQRSTMLLTSVRSGKRTEVDDKGFGKTGAEQSSAGLDHPEGEPVVHTPASPRGFAGE